MLLEIAIGDAYGAAFEFKNSMLEYNNVQDYYAHPTHGLKPGTYTDDTQMSIGVAEVLLREDNNFSRENFANSFVDCFKRDYRYGYARGFQNFLTDIGSGKEFLEKILPHSDKNGAAMRSVPIGVLKDMNQVEEVATVQAKLTHDTTIGIDSSRAVALASHYLRYKIGSRKDLPAWLDQKIPGYSFTTEWTKSVPCHGIATAKAVITLVSRYDTWNHILFHACAFGGDTDSVASIALGLASQDKETFDTNLNPNLYNKLENINYGKDFLIELDQKLDQKFPV